MNILGYAAKLVEFRTLYDDRISERLDAKIHGGRHTLVQFAVEDGGWLGAHALSVRAVRKGRRSRNPSRDPRGGIRSDGPPQVSLWGQRWQRHISTWLHLTQSMQLLMLFSPHQAANAIFS